MNLLNEDRSFIKVWALFAMLALLLLFSSLSHAQSTPQTITTTSASTPSGCASISVDGNKGAVGFHVGGTWTGTLQPEISIQGNAPSNVQVTPYSSSSAQSTVTANGDYYVNQVAGATVFYLCGPTSTGTANIYINSSTALNIIPGSGGGGGSVSSVFGRTGTVVATTGDYTCAQVTGCQSTTPPGSNGDIIFNNAGAFGGSATTINSAGTITVPDTQKVTDAAGNFIEFLSTGLSVIDASGDSIFLNSGQAIILDSASDFISAGGGTNKWQIDNAAGSASITNPVSGGGAAIAFHGSIFTFDQGLVLNGATGGNKGAGSLNAQSLYINGTAVSAGTYTFFGNTANPLTALVDPTTIQDANGSAITFFTNFGSPSIFVSSAGALALDAVSDNSITGATVEVSAQTGTLALTGATGTSVTGNLTVSSTLSTPFLSVTTITSNVGFTGTPSFSGTNGFNFGAGSATAGNYARANGTTFLSSAIQASDLPGGSIVNSVTGDGTIFNNSASTGAVTLTLANTVTGTGGVVLKTSPTLVTPVLGAATGTSLALTDTANNTDISETNSTTATSGTTNASPLHGWTANYWTGAASATDTWRVGSSLTAGTNGASILTFSHSGSTGFKAVSTPNNLQFTTSGSDIDMGANASGWTLNLSDSNGADVDGTITYTPGASASLLVQAPVAGTQLLLEGNRTTQTGSGVKLLNLSTWTGTSGSPLAVSVGGTFAPPSGTASYELLNVAGTIGGTTSGNTWGLVVNPVLTATNLTGTNLIADFQSNGTSEVSINYSGGVKASYFQSAGTKFTASGCSNSTTVGGATAGSYDSGTSGTCTVTVTLGGSVAASNGWACSVWDVTTTADVQKQTAYTTTTVTFSGTTVSGDVIVFGCQAF